MAKAMTAVKVRGVKREGYHGDKGEGAARGLYVQVAYLRRGGVRSAKYGVTRSWIFRFVSPITRKTRWMGLGPCDVIGLAEARELARAARRLVVLGTDPIEHRKTTTEADRAAVLRMQAGTMTFEQCAQACFDMHSKTWKNDKHRQQWQTSLRRANAAFGSLNVAEIDTPIIAKFIEPIWNKTPETGSRMRSRIEKVLDFATARKFRQGENPARWDGHLEHVLHARPKAEHHSAMPVTEVPAFMSRLRERDSVSARALEVLILTALRTSEVIEARWDEIDLDAKVWTVPASRMKKGKEHSVPLSGRVLDILQAMPRVGEFVFPSKVTNKPLSNMAMLQLLRGMDCNGYTAHGFRSSFRDWAGDVSTFDRETIEHALAHGLKDKTEAAYRRSSALEKRRLLMTSWDQYCSGSAAGSDVTPLTGRRA
jgi:integrase